MNPVYYEWTNRRNFIYGVRIYENQFTNSEDYKKEVNYIQINLNGYEDDTINKTEEVYYVMSKEGKKWIKDFEIREINIPYCLKLWYDGDRREQVRWGSIFGCKDKKEFSEIIEDDGLMGKETKEKLENCVDKITHQTRYWWDYEKDEQMILNSIKSDAREEGHAEGRAEGLVEGRAEEKLETARKMKEKGIALSLISEITSLSLEEIEKL
jgi:predicted transposase/invertase (TIGR01784 family)